MLNWTPELLTLSSFVQLLFSGVEVVEEKRLAEERR
jgi:hypothetical protein